MLPLMIAIPLFTAPGSAGAQAPVAQYNAPFAGYGADAQLSQYLSLLGQNPNNLAALVGAGRAALELGQGEAALNFYGRAEELSPQDGPVKAGLGSALVLMEQPETALQFFYEAFRLGVQPVDMAAFRGLAYDLTGDPARAQQDYNLALRRREDPEVRLRLALSLAISGQRDQALAMIHDQLRRQERAAWRTRAFILALTGDAQGAMRDVETTMPGQAAALAPFLARLPNLSAAERARAVHFGHFPGEPRQAQLQAPVAGPLPSPLAALPAAPSRPMEPATVAGRPDIRQPALGQSPSPAASPPLAIAPARSASAMPPPALTQPSPVLAQPSPVLPQPSAEVSIVGGPQLPAATSAPVAGQAFASLTPLREQPAPGQALTPPTAALPSATSHIRSEPRVAPAPTRSQEPGKSASAPSATPITRLADLPSILAGLSDPPAPKAATRAPAAGSAAAKGSGTKQAANAAVPAKPGAGEAKGTKSDGKAGSSAKSKPEKAAPKEPSRIWVQVARTPKGAAAGEYRRMKSRAPKAFAARTGWTADQGQNQRLLVGPFKTSKEAQDFVTVLKKEDLEAFSWTSAESQEVKKLPAK